MKINPKMIPRFNEDYSLSDFVTAVSSNCVASQPLMDKNRILVNNIFGSKYSYFTNDGRTSLYCILKSMNLPTGSYIGVPLYSCTAIFDSIIQAGHLPCFIDIDLDSYTLSIDDLKEKIHKLSALVVIHTFGIPAKMEEILGIVDNLPVIEDCAHSLFSTYKNKLTGSIADASFFSLKKYLCIGGGGLVLINKSANLSHEVNNNILKLPNNSFFDETFHPLKTYSYSFMYHKPWFGIAGCLFGSYVSNRKKGNTGFVPMGIRKDSLLLFGNKISCLHEKIAHQRTNSFELLSGLKDTSLKLPLEPRNSFWNYYLFPIKFDSEYSRDNSHKGLRAQNIDTAKLYSKTPLIAKKLYGYLGDCPNSEDMAATNLLVPNYYTLKKEQILSISNKIINVVG